MNLWPEPTMALPGTHDAQGMAAEAAEHRYARRNTCDYGWARPLAPEGLSRRSSNDFIVAAASIKAEAAGWVTSRLDSSKSQTARSTSDEGVSARLSGNPTSHCW